VARAQHREPLLSHPVPQLGMHPSGRRPRVVSHPLILTQQTELEAAGIDLPTWKSPHTYSYSRDCGQGLTARSGKFVFLLAGSQVIVSHRIAPQPSYNLRSTTSESICETSFYGTHPACNKNICRILRGYLVFSSSASCWCLPDILSNRVHSTTFLTGYLLLLVAMLSFAGAN
jgi:hypothetical protein